MGRDQGDEDGAGAVDQGDRRAHGDSRNTIRSSVRTPEPPSYGPRPKRPSKVDPFVWRICELLEDEPTLSGVRILEEITDLGYSGAKAILDDRLRELRPRYLPPPRTHQRTVYRPAELYQFDLCEPRREIPVGHGQTRRGCVVTAELPYSRAFAGARLLQAVGGHRLGHEPLPCHVGVLPRQLVWDREGAIAPRGRPTEPFLAFCGALSAGWVILEAGDYQAKGALERTHRFVHGNFEAGRRFAKQLDFSEQLDRWCERINRRKHRTTRAVVSERLAEERQRMRPLPEPLPDVDRAGWCAFRPSPTCALTEPTTRSIRTSSDGG